MVHPASLLAMVSWQYSSNVNSEEQWKANFRSNCLWTLAKFQTCIWTQMWSCANITPKQNLTWDWYADCFERLPKRSSVCSSFCNSLLFWASKKIILLNIQNNKHGIKPLLMCILCPFPCLSLTTVCKKHGNTLAIIATHYSEGESFAV